MIRLTAACRFPQTNTYGYDMPVWGCNLERGLFVQKQVDTWDIRYGVTHHSGFAVAYPAFRFLDARQLQQRLLALPVDWTQSAEAIEALARDTQDPQRAIISSLVRHWQDTFCMA